MSEELEDGLWQNIREKSDQAREAAAVVLFLLGLTVPAVAGAFAGFQFIVASPPYTGETPDFVVALLFAGVGALFGIGVGVMLVDWLMQMWDDAKRKMKRRSKNGA